MEEKKNPTLIEALRNLSGLLVYFKGFVPHLVLAFLMILILTGSTLYRPFILKEIIDASVAGSSFSHILQFALIFVGLVGLSMTLSYFQSMLMARVGLNIVNRIKSQLFAHILNLPLTFFNRYQTGWVLSRVESDTEQLKQFCSSLTIRILMDSILFVSILITIYRTDATIATYILPLVILMLLLIMLYLGRLRRIYEAVRTKYAELSGFLSEYIQAVPLIQLYQRQSEIKAELKEKNEQRFKTEVSSSFNEHTFWAIFLFVSETVVVGILLYVGSFKVVNQEMTIGTLIMLLEFSRQMVAPIHSFSENFNAIQRSAIAAGRVAQILNTEKEEDRGSMPPEIQSIELKDVGFYYKEGEWVLRNLNLVFQKGQKIALVGASGGGKSTIIQLLGRYYDPQEGAILLNNQPLDQFSRSQFRQKIGLVLQDIYLFPGTILDNLRVLGTEVSEQDVLEAAENLGILGWLQGLPQGVHTELSERAANLSMGERQLLSFLRAMIKKPELLILDEATASMDPHTEKILQDATEKMLQGRSALIIAHRLATVRSLDQILVLASGAVKEKGTHSELMALNGFYRRLHDIQAKEDQRGDA